METNTPLVHEALSAFGVQDKPVTFIRHNENMTFNVADVFLLRIHKPTQSFQSVNRYADVDSNKIRQSEIKFLQHLRQNGMPVQVPMKVKSGENIAVLSGGVEATLLQWIPGRILTKEDINETLCLAIGQLVAKMHRASEGFMDEEGLRYDAKLCQHLKVQLLNANTLLVDQRNLLYQLCDHLTERLGDQKDFIALHSDLSLSNLLMTTSGLVPIDFSLFGYAHPMMDIASLFACIGGAENRAAIAKGYCTEGNTIDFKVLDAYYVLSVLLYIVIHLENAKNEAFQKNLLRWERQIFVPFMQNNPLISERFQLIHASK